MSAAGRKRARGSGGPEPQGPEADNAAADRAAREPRGFGRWRNWRLPVKFAAVVLVPVVFAVLLGGVQIRDQVQRAQRYDELTRLTEARNKIQPLLTGLQKERTRAAELLAGSAPNVKPYRMTAKKVTVAVKKAPEVLHVVEQYSPLTSAQFVELRRQLARLPKVRKQVLTSSITPAAAVNAYNDMVNALLSMERAVINTLGDARLYGTINALFELSRAEDEIRIQRALVVAGLAKNDFTAPVMDGINDSRARLQSRIAGFRAAASPAQERTFQQLTSGEAMEQRTGALEALSKRVANYEPDNPSLTLQQWAAMSEQVIKATTEVRYGLSQDFEDKTDELANDSSRRAILVIAGLALALVLATLVIVVVSRNLLGSLRTLRRSALDAAERRLPEAVAARIRDGGSGAELEPVPVATTEEVGQVARAFDEVNRQALYLASEQASLRRGYSDSFINISRRSQSLLERQLRLFESLEQDEDDPDQLATLFRLDHLATRMRRNNENLMVLSGSDMARRFNQPVELADVLRAAVSEIEHYPRVIVQSPPETRLVGYAASDLVRLMAELLDNAANFSAPNTSVTVSSYQSDDGSITVDVLDSGIGMDDEEVAEANHRLASFDEYDLATSRRMGLLVIARLAGRHGITVRLHGGRDYDGVRASVALPADLVASQRPGGPGGSGASGLPGGGSDSTQQLPQHGSSQPGSSQPGSSGFGPGAGEVGGTPSAIEQQMSPDPAASAQGRNGMHQEIPPARQEQNPNNGSRHQILEGGLPQTPLSSGNSGFGNSEPGGSTAQMWPPEPQQTGGDDQSGVELESPEQLRGLFEPATHTEETEEPDAGRDAGPDAGTGGAEPAGLPPAPSGGRRGSQAPQGGRSAPDGAGQGASPILSEMATQWFQPAPENAQGQESDSRQAEAPQAPQVQQQASQAQQQAWPGSGQAAESSAAPSTSWAFNSDVAAQDPGPARSSEPVGYTASGLPRRGRRDRSEQGAADSGASSTSAATSEQQADRSAQSQLPGEWPRLPGTSADAAAGAQSDGGAQSNGGAQGNGSKRDPEDLRGRLSSFQQGARQNQAAATSGATEGSTDTDVSAWNFSTDRAQQEAEAAANPKPSEFTAAGLPRRTPRAHLAPGSAGPPQEESSSGPANKPEPDEVRGRLSSFQQGIRRGRHSAGD